MPQKKNMAVLECLKARVAPVTGALVSALAAYKATPYTHVQDGYNEGLRWAWDAFEETLAAVKLCHVVIDKAVPNEARMLELVRKNFSTVTDLADMLVKNGDFSFREAHHVIGRAVRFAVAQGLTADQISVDHIRDAAREVLGKSITLDPAAVRAGLDPVQAVERRAGSGSPASRDIVVMLRALTSRLQADGEQTQSRRAMLVDAQTRLADAIKEMSGQKA